jgi:hypothetical protein
LSAKSPVAPKSTRASERVVVMLSLSSISVPHESADAAPPAGKKRIALVPLGGTKVNWASSTAASVFQSLRAVLMLSSAGVSVSVTTYLRGNGRLPSATQIWKSTPGRLNSR